MIPGIPCDARSAPNYSDLEDLLFLVRLGYYSRSESRIKAEMVHNSSPAAISEAPEPVLPVCVTPVTRTFRSWLERSSGVSTATLT